MLDLKFQKKVIEANGQDRQTFIHVEELSELQKALTKMQRHQHGDKYVGCPLQLREDIIEEIADVQICIAQMEIMYGITDQEVVNRMDRKQDRQRARMEEHK